MSITTKTLLRLSILTVTYAFVGMALSFAVLTGYNKAYGMHASTDAATPGTAIQGTTSKVFVSPANSPAVTPLPTGKTLSAQTLKVSVPTGAEGVSFSYDGKYMVYLTSGKLYVVDLVDGSTQALPEKAPVELFQLMADRNIILFFTHQGDNLYVKTYSIDNDIMTLQKTITVTPGSSIKGSDYSSNTNIIAINVAPSGGIGRNAICLLNVMKKLKESTTSRAVNNLMLLNNKLGYYSVDDNNNLYYNLKPVQALSGTAVRLLGCDQNDMVYVQSKSDSHTIYSIHDSGITGSILIDDSSFTTVYSTKTGIYFVYPDHIVNITGKANAITPYNQGLKFLAVGGSTAYFEDRANMIVSLPVR